MENKAIFVSRTIYPVGRSVGKSTDLADLHLTVVTVTKSTWEETRRCTNCGHQKKTHMADGACLFEPTQYQAPPMPAYTEAFTQVDSWSNTFSVEKSMNHGAAPKIYRHKDVVRRTFKAPRPPKARR